MAKKAKKSEDTEVKVKKKKKGADLEENRFDAAADVIAELDNIELSLNALSGMDDDGAATSTGMLVMDLLNGGGLRPAMYTHAGGEQSAKTTSALTVALTAALTVPIVYLFDYEGSTKNSIPYIMNIARSVGFKAKNPVDIFGLRDPNSNRYVVQPKIRYRSESVLEKFFDVIHATLKRLPDVRNISGKWYYVYEDDKANKARYGDLAIQGMAKKYGKGIYLQAESGNLQAVFLTDSWASMNPASNDQEGDSDNSIAVHARAFSKHLKRIKGRLAAKRVAIIGINQLRTAPMVMYGPKETEPGGEALKYYSDCRVRHTSRALSAAPFGKPKGEGQFEHEKSVTGKGHDTYRYVHVKANKCKMGIPNRTGFIRIWVEDSRGNAWGVDPVWDTLWYLWSTGQMTIRNRASIRLNIVGLGESDTVIKWSTMKEWILGSKDQKKAICADLGFKPVDLRKFCFDQMKKGVGEALFVAHQQGDTKDDDEEDSDD